jgi:murein DD-endopeptidase MepM/ murein hydrolase activator NlpD
LAQIIQSEFGDLDDNQQLILESFDQDAVITPVQQSYLDSLDSFRASPKVSMDKGEEEIEIPTIQNGGSIIKPDLAKTEKAKRDRTETIDYVVLAGDTVSTIAQEYEVSVNTILWENNKSSYSIIRPGDTLRILPQTGLNHAIVKGDSITTIAKKYDVEEELIMKTNKLASGDTLKIGQKLFIPNGKKISQPVYAPKSYTGFSAITDIVKTPNAIPATGNKMNWPTVGARITQYYSWRHHGLDIANKTGTAIYAADAGTVEVAGWGTGYGNQIVIDHGGGKKTRYAHLSKFYVEKGATVSKGQTIAAMGSTGWSTGPHLHFEVIINNVKYNPLNYIK